MPADANIFSQYLRAPKSVIEYQNDYDQADARKNALQLSAMDVSERTQANQRAQQIRNALMGLGGAATDEQRIATLKGTGTPEGFAQADALEKALQERLKTGAQVKLSTSQAGHADAQTAAEKAKTQAAMIGHLGDAISALQTLPGVTPAHVAATIQNAGKMYGIPEAQVQAALSQIPQDPAQLPAFLKAKNDELMTAKERASFLTPDANTVANNVTSVENNKRTNFTSRQNNADTIGKDLKVAGIEAGGGLDANTERTAQAIASGQLPAPTGMALLNPKNQRILGRVMEINPQYDSTSVDAKRKAARDFTSGNQGNAMRSFAVAGQHLDQLGELVTALDNGNLQVVNKLGNIIAAQTGSTAPTNFEAAKDIVSKEVTKAIVGSGAGGVAERAELAHLLDNAKTPAQLMGVIKVQRNLMAAQHEALLTQRRAAGLPDSTLPNYAESSGGAAAPVPKDIKALLEKHGEK